MVTERDYLDAGDRVVVLSRIAEPAHARIPQPEAAGQHGTIKSNDGWGLCGVLLDNGSWITAWNACDLAPEADESAR